MQPRRPLVPVVVERPALDLPALVEPQAVAVVPPRGLGRPQPSDAEVWRRIVTPGSDALFGLPFDRAVVDAPLLVEAVVLQHIYGALQAARAPVQLDVAQMAWQARNDLVRRVHGGMRPMEIATSQELNWAQWAITWEMYFRATGRTQSFVDATMALQAGFQSACQVAAAAAQRTDSLEDREGWARLAACIQAQAEFLANLIFAPVRREAGAPPAEPWPEARPVRRAPPRRLAGGPAALPGPVQVPEPPVVARAAPSPRLEVLSWDDGSVLRVERASASRFLLEIAQADGAPLAQAEVEPSTRSVHQVTGDDTVALRRLRMACLQMAGLNRVSRAANATWLASMDVSPGVAQDAAMAIGDAATDQIVGPGGLSGASAQALDRLVQAALVPADAILVAPSAWFVS